ncbi:MAG TPA: hypothetical protein VNL18_04775 [Gemmatimonadales bacterium]|nr:hypothetical protein [Gemmatimonadales bacterium]
MRRPLRRRLRAICVPASLSLIVLSCDVQPPAHPIFASGRAIAPAGDTLLAVTRAGLAGIEVTDRRTGAVDTLGLGQLVSPHQIELFGDRWYVSDVDQGRPSVVVLTPDGRVERRYDLRRWGAVPHQFAVLPDGRLVIETSGRLLALRNDTATTFVEFPAGPKSGLLASASGGVLHALPDRHITLYNEFGNVRWRIDWPWLETAFVTDLSVDSNGRIHVIAGVPSDGTFIVYNLANTTGEVVRWSVPGPYASFTVDHFGEIRADSALGMLPDSIPAEAR